MSTTDVPAGGEGIVEVDEEEEEEAAERPTFADLFLFFPVEPDLLLKPESENSSDSLALFALLLGAALGAFEAVEAGSFFLSVSL